MLDVLNRYAHGFIVVPTVIASRRGGLISTLEAGPLSAGDICRKLSANSGHLQVALRLFESLGWIEAGPDAKYRATPELQKHKLVPDDLWALLDTDMDAYLRGGNGRLLSPYIDRSKDRWNIDDEMIADFCDSLLVVPLLTLLAKRGRLAGLIDNGFADLPQGVREEVISVLLHLKWIEDRSGSYSLTPPGEFMFERAVNLGLAESYRPLLIAMHDLLFGDAEKIFGSDENGDELHVDRNLNVIASGFMHDRFFAEVEEIVVSVFSKSPLSEQPKYVADMGCGDGTFLRRVYETVRDKTPRGKKLDEYPLTLIGIDLNQASLDETSQTLSEINHTVVTGDIGNPRQVIHDIAELGIDTDSILHIRSFLDHDRPYIEPRDAAAIAAKQNARYLGAYVDRHGQAIPPALAVQSLVEHLHRWTEVITDHGFILLEVHCQDPQVVRQYIDQSESLYFDAIEGYSHQLLVEADAALMAAAEAGLFPNREYFRKFPGVMPYCRITLNQYEKRPYIVRMATASDLPALLRLESACWPERMRAPEAELLRRIEAYALGQWLLELEGEVVGVVYTQRVSSVDALRNARLNDIGALSNEHGSVVQLLSLNVLPEKQQLGLGDQLLDLILMRSSLQGGVTKVAGLTRCAGFSGSSIEELDDYIGRRDATQMPLDPILRFHHSHGAVFLGAVPNFRPEDVDNLGAGVLLCYDFSGPGTDLRAPEVSVSENGPGAGKDARSSLETCLRTVLGRARQSAFSWDRSLRDMGIDSLGLLEFRMLLERGFELKLSPTFFFSHPNLTAIRKYLEDESEPQQQDVDQVLPSLDLAIRVEDDQADAVSTEAKVEEQSVAIIGMSGRFPGCPDLDAFWELLTSGGDAISEVPASRWDIDAFFDENPDAPGKLVSRHGGFLDAVDEFDAGFFDIPPSEARLMDPQQRLLLEVHWEAFENAGVDVAGLRGSSCGIFVGMYSHDYELLQVASGGEDDLGAYYATGNSASIAAGRVAYCLGSRGPALTIDTACSSSLVAVHQAIQSIRSGQCRLAVASGANLLLSPRLSIIYSKAGMLAVDGRCKTFDASADGYVRSEGCGAVVLKRLDHARRDGDRILGVLRGSCINQDGASNGLTAPNLVAQEELLRGALADAGLRPFEIDFIEAHGTGTNLGDPVEFAALNNVFGSDPERNEPLLLASAKTNIGHAEAAAGIAGLIKTVLAMQHQTMPAHLNFHDANPLIPLDDLPAKIPLHSEKWHSAGRPLRAGVSSFGFSGTNAHVLVEQAPPPLPDAENAEISDHLLPISAKSPVALEALARHYIDWLPGQSDAQIADICHTARIGRAHHGYRIAALGSDTAGLAKSLEQSLSVTGGQRPPAAAPRIAFLFTGQGAQYLNMARELAVAEPCFRENLRRCVAVLATDMDRSLEELIYAGPADCRDDSDALNDTAVTQPALFAIEYALARMLQSWGIEPCAVMGHSVGEYVAACIAGVFSPEDGMKLIAARGRLMASLPAGGAMCAVLGKRQAVHDDIIANSSLSIAAFNGPENLVISGSEHDLQQVIGPLEEGGLKLLPLQVSHAFHSQLMEPILPAFREVTRWVSFNTPKLKLVSNVSGKFEQQTVTRSDYWVSHIREPVRFEQSVDTLLDDGIDIMLEVGPHPVLTYMGRAIEAFREDGDEKLVPTWVGTLDREAGCWDSLHATLKTLYERGVNLNWSGIDAALGGRITSIPNYPWQRKSYWFEDRIAADSTSGASAAGNELYQPVWLARARTDSNRPGRPSADLLRELPQVEVAAHWVILADQSGVAVGCADALTRRGDSCDLIYLGKNPFGGASSRCVASPDDLRSVVEGLTQCRPGDDCRLLDLWPLDQPNDELSGQDPLDAVVDCGLQFVDVVRAAAAGEAITLTVVTASSRQVHEGDTINTVTASLAGLGNVAWAEYPGLSVQQVDLDAGDGTEVQIACLLEEITSPERDIRVAYRSGQRHVQTLQPLECRDTEFRCSADGSYLIVGGKGDLGMHSARYLVEQGARKLVLVGRSEFPDKATWDDLENDENLGPKIRLARDMEAAGAQVDFRALDVCDRQQVKALIDDVTASGPIRGVVQAAAVISDQLIGDVTARDYRAVLLPKVAGSWHLLAALDEQALEFFAFFSSVGSVIGLPGQSSYAAANAYFDALAARLHASGVNAVSINWCGWQGTGLARTDGGRRAIAELGLVGIDSLHANDAVELLGIAINSGSRQVVTIPLVAATGSSDSFRGIDPQLHDLRQRFGSPPKALATQPEIARKGEFVGLDAEELDERIGQLVIGTVAELLDLGIADVGLDSSFGDLGMDSLLGLEFRKIIQARCGVVLSATLVWNYPTVGATAAYIGQLLGATAGNSPATSADAASSPESAEETGSALSRIDELSDEDALQELIGESKAS